MPKSDKRTITITDKFLLNWRPDMTGKKSVYVRDAKCNLLLVCFSKRGTHSWAYDYSKKGVHKSKVFGYYPAMSITQARKQANEIKIEVIDKDRDYDDVFEIHRHPSYVYFLETQENMIKIGRSTNWMNRIKELTDAASGIRLIGIREETDVFNENNLHNLYRKYRQPRNEYFKDVKGLIKAIIIEAVVHHRSDKVITKIMADHEKIIYT